MKLGLFDSGIGGLTVLRRLIELVPKLEFVYLGDSHRFPYGTKSAREIKHCALTDAGFLVAQRVEALLIACHTASSVAAEDVRRAFKDRVIVWDMVEPTLSELLELGKVRIGVIGTQATIASRVYERALSKSSREVTVAPAESLVDAIEARLFDRNGNRLMDIVRASLNPFLTRRVDVLVLACTHFPFVRDLVGDVMGTRVRVLDPAEIVARKVAHELTKMEDVGSVHGLRSAIYVTAGVERFRRQAKRSFPQIKASVELVDPLE